MAKRELIDRNNLDSTTIVTDDFSGNEVLEVVLMEDVKEAPVITEQEIVKPYLERLKRRMKARDDDNGGEPLNAVDRGYHLAYEHLCEEIDNLLRRKRG
jgi:hypothetical protein